VIGRVRHLHEERLFECYVAERSGEAVDPPSASHLSSCGECRARYTELSRFMEGLREEAEAETDALFTPQQLRVQQQQIVRRLEHLGQPARVLSFPARLIHRHLAGHAQRIAPRWAAAAAVAGLFVGVGLGVFFDSRTGSTPIVMTALTAARTPPQVAPIAATVSPAPVLDVDAFLSELEAALGGPLNQELLPFDALTPRVQEISSRPLRY
jgi:predicted anti-sigma-YlaC factor YlaD